MSWSFRRVTRDDFGLVGTWLADPDVRRWWNQDPSPEGVEHDFGPGVDGREPGEDLIAELDGRPVGLVQRSRIGAYAEDLEIFDRIAGPVEAGATSLDYLVGAPADRGRGLGPAMIDAVVRSTFEDPAVPYVLVAVVAANRRSWRMLQKAGFRVVGSGDAGPDNPVDPPLHHVLRRDRGSPEAVPVLHRA